MTEKTKHMLMNFIPLCYGIDVVFANILGVIIGAGFSTPSMTPDFMNEWVHFLYNAPKALYFSQYLSFLVPTVLCVLYTRSSKENFENRFINLPLAYSAIGISGWVIYLIEQIIYLIVAVNQGYQLEVVKILLVSGMHIILSTISTFTLVYFVLEFFHRTIVLPLYFPGGQISKKKGIIKPSIKFLFSVNYISVTLFPVILLVILYTVTTSKYSIPIEKSSLIMLIAVLVFGLVITFFFGNEFEKPLKKLQNRINKLNEGDYESKVNIVRNDILGEISDSFNDMTNSIIEKTQKIIDTQNSVIQGMAIMVESRDNSTGGHIKRTSDCVKVFVNKLKQEQNYKDLPQSFFENVIKAAPMHDLGKIAVDDAVLRKPGKFTEQEYEMMKTHSKEGSRIVENVLNNIDDKDFKTIAINVAHYHHEKWDGNGYPEKISGTEIPLEARIMALADVFDALVSKRCYKEEFSFDKAFSIIKDSLGTHFDPKLGELFIECREQLQELYSWNY